ncbi:MAG: hypothetical protein LBL94_05200 [Prevotellaceae bacterium]|jgi:hypothetical protein|nr:hypothetical protein [Prevotellaceae bacterium]
MKLSEIIRILGGVVSRYQVEVYVTIIFHLALAVALMSLKLHRVAHSAPIEIMLDFSDEKVSKYKALQREKEQLEQEVGLLLRQTRERLRNAAVSEEWEKESSSERDWIFDENDELQKKLDATRQVLNRAASQDDKSLDGSSAALQSRDAGMAKGDKKPAAEERYTGPSVMSYSLKGRKAFVLPVPVYMCEKGGEVVVNIAVARNGSVSAAGIDEKKSAADLCIREAARQAALLSKFSVSAQPKSQQGTITYRFVPQ